MIIFVRYAELALKLGNRAVFEQKLEKNIKAAMAGLRFKTSRHYGHMMLEVSEKDSEGVAGKLANIPGISNFSIVSEILKFKYPKSPTEKWAIAKLTEIAKIMALEIISPGEKKYWPKTFCVRSKRIQKSFPMDSPKIEAKLGEMILRGIPKLKVKLKNPEITCHADLVDNKAYIYFDKIAGLGGLPVGTSGKIVSLISSGIDSPVASFRMTLRGAQVVFVHFHSYPHTNKASQDNVREIVKLLTQYQLESRLYFVPFLEIQKAVMTNAEPELRVVLYRRFMMKIAEEIAVHEGAGALVTGENLGQVASQTLDNIAVINEAVAMPILRPLIGHSKQEIIDEARKIGTYEISIRPYADCCSLFVPKHPTTRADLAVIKKVEKKAVFKKLIKEAIKKAEIENAVLS
ncbi:tRNA 4-thiouridine(8) synthase ThiI [Candidatus Peregrinibacteria bacterium]|nr:tRNA 4-thiouridine(8) synthase ThiI [Candidatus Peregrinibacteria bacterium]